MRVVPHALFRVNDADGCQASDNLSIHVFNIRTMQPDGFGDLAANGIDGIQRSGGFLKDLGDAAATHRPQA